MVTTDNHSKQADLFAAKASWIVFEPAESYAAMPEPTMDFKDFNNAIHNTLANRLKILHIYSRINESEHPTGKAIQTKRVAQKSTKTDIS